MTKDEALKLALDFIERVNKDGWILADFEPEMYAVITAIKEALKQSEQEPVAWFSTLPDGKLSIKIVGKPMDGNWEPLYTTPPQRTEQEREACERCKQLEEQAYDLVGELRVANIKLSMRPQRTWVGLTDEEIDALHTSIKVRLMGTFDTKDIYRVVEQALKEKNT